MSIGALGVPSSYSLSAGTLNVNSELTVGSGSTFTQSGGLYNAFDRLIVDGTYALSGNATLNLDGGAFCAVGSSGAGTFLQDGGTVNLGFPPILQGFPVPLGGQITIASGGPGTGHYRLNSGVISGYGALIGIGGSTDGSGSFEMNGGVLDMSGLMLIGNLVGNGTGGTFLYNGGTLSVKPIEVELEDGSTVLLDGVQLFPGGTFAANGPGDFNGKFTQLGGTVTGTLRNHGTFVFNSGSFLGQMINSGTFQLNDGNFAATVTMTNEAGALLSGSGTIGTGLINRGTINPTGALTTTSIANSGIINVAAGTSLTPQSIDNFNRINLSGGKILGTGTIINEAAGTLGGGVIAGGGTIDVHIDQAGGTLRADNPAIPMVITAPITTSNPASQIVVTPNCLLSLQSSLANSAIVSLQGGGARIVGSTIANTGTIKGAGEIANQVINNGIIRAEGGELSFSDANDSNAGLIQVGANAVRFSEGLQTSTGSISLSGGEFDNGTAPLNNAGTILGRGTLRASSINNSATMTLSGGVTDVFATVNNMNRINVTGSGATNFYDPVDTTVGTINVNLGSTVTFFGNVSGVSHITGAGIKDFEAGASIGGVNTQSGATVVGPAGNLTASFIRDDVLSVVGRATISPNGTAAGTSRVNSLIIDGNAVPTGTLDLNDNDLIVTAASYAEISGSIRNARHNGAWDQPGLTSTTARTTSPAVTTLGALTGRQFHQAQGGNATFDGFVVANSDMLVKYTWYGDTDFNGKVDGADYARIDATFNNELGGNIGGWLNGDFDYNDKVDGADYALIDSAFNSQSGTLRQMLSFLDGTDRDRNAMTAPGLRLTMMHFDQFGDAYVMAVLSNVPEPGALTTLGLIGPMLARRQRRRD